MNQSWENGVADGRSDKQKGRQKDERMDGESWIYGKKVLRSSDKLLNPKNNPKSY